MRMASKTSWRLSASWQHPGLWSVRHWSVRPIICPQGGCPMGTCPWWGLSLLKATEVLAIGLYWELNLLSPSTLSPWAQPIYDAQRFCMKYSFKRKQEKPAWLPAASGRLVFSVPGGQLPGWTEWKMRLRGWESRVWGNEMTRNQVCCTADLKLGAYRESFALLGILWKCDSEPLF